MLARPTLWLLVLASSVVLVDQATKILAEAYLSRSQSVNVIGELVRFRLAYNDGAAFSFLSGYTWLLTITSSIAVLALLWFGPRAKTTSWLVIAALVLGGASGNLLDRLFREPGFAVGHVVDFIQFPLNFPIFNLADSALVIGVALVFWRTLRGDEFGGQVASGQQRDS